MDLALERDIAFVERVKLRFRAEVFNVFNRAQYGAPNANLSAANFGVITTTISSYATGRGTPREFQLSQGYRFRAGLQSRLYRDLRAGLLSQSCAQNLGIPSVE